MIDIESYFMSTKVPWVAWLLNKVYANWKLIALTFLKLSGKNLLVFLMNIDTFKDLLFFSLSQQSFMKRCE